MLDQFAANILVGSFDRFHHLAGGDVVSLQSYRVQIDLIFTYHSSDGGNLGHPGDSIELVAHEPVLQRAQLFKIIPFALDGVPEDMPHAGAVRTQGRNYAGRQQRCCVVQPLQHAGSCPIDVRLVLKDHVDHGKAEGRGGSHGTHLGQALQIGCQRIGDLILHHLW